MVESTIVVASEDPGTFSLSGVETWSVCPTVYNGVQMCVYHFEAKAEECVCAWVDRMIYCAIWGLVHVAAPSALDPSNGAVPLQKL